MISLIRLKHILAVARCGNFSIAAEDCGISQPALTRSIQAFEQQYDVRLFDRGTGGSSLTPAGKLAVEHARSLLAAAGDFDRDMALFGKGQAGRTGIGMGPMIASLLLPHLGAVCMRQSPHLTFLTRIGRPDEMLDALLEGAIELIVGNSWQLSLVPGVTEEPLGVMPMGIVVRANHPLATSTRLTMSDVSAFPAARTFDLPSSHLAKEAGAFVCENFDILRKLVLKSDCTCLVSPALVRADLEQGQLCLLDVVDLPLTETHTSLVYLKGRTPSPASLHLAEAVRLMMKDLVSDT